MKNKLRSIRRRKRVNQAEIARRTHIHPSTISRLETRTLKGNIHQWTQIAKSLGVPVGELVDKPSSLRG